MVPAQSPGQQSYGCSQGQGEAISPHVTILTARVDTITAGGAHRMDDGDDKFFSFRCHTNVCVAN